MTSQTIEFDNTLSGRKDSFQPLDHSGEKNVGLYTCGPTVYDFAHIGNFRAFVFEDLLRRFLECRGYRVRHVMNLTDVDDKTIAGAHREGKALEEFTARFSQAFNEDLRALNCLTPHDQPRATRKIPQMLELIQTLVEKGIAYENEGSVYYRVAKFAGYGKLSKKKLDMNIAGASDRVDVDEYDREQVSDFVLWKKAKEGEPSWESPWGPGRPGWHIECSAMSMECLGPTFDIHAGGEDLIFPHHENEIAQSEAATGKPFVKYWLHCKFLLVDGEKMSKSKGNFYTLRDLLAKGCDPMALRLALLATHYRSPLNFTLEGVKEASESVKKMDDCYALVSSISYQSEFSTGGYVENSEIVQFLENAVTRVLNALSDDLNVSEAFAVIFEAVREINRAYSEKKIDQMNYGNVLRFFEKMDSIFGFDIEPEKMPNQILEFLKRRDQVRKSPEFRSSKELQSESDKLRAQIAAHGWIVKDGRLGEAPIAKVKRRKWD